ncbi:MAG TPA: ROK family protein [Bryobacteraceae bacterium]|nr:ROK family protein [Bryobacteraceae bacterium]
MPCFGGIEAGGTKFVCAVGTGPADIETTEFPTTQPDETIARAVEFFRAHPEIAAIGIASFGPIDPNLESPTFGYITSTPKPGWRNCDFAGAIGRALGVPVAFDTDVNAAALAEHRWGAARGLANFIYVTVGTGIGGGAMLDGRLLHGRLHPEMGHVRIPHDRLRDPFAGNCPYHGDCLEGLAAGPAIEARWGQPGNLLPDGHAAWNLEGEYLALGILNWTVTLAPQRIILGGGIMQRRELLPKIPVRLAELLNGYMDPPDLVSPELGTRAGVLGAIALATDLPNDPPRGRMISRHN